MKKGEIHTDKGVMKIEFYEEDAPATVANFINLAEDGFYDGLTFHRVIPGRAGRYLPAPPQIRTSGFPASGSSRVSFAILKSKSV